MKEPFKSPMCDVGTPVKCGDVVRLEHLDTGKNLHSHLFRAPLSGFQEVSGFGENGYGDTGDNWKISCDSSSSGGTWDRQQEVTFIHVDTGKYLSTGGNFKFTMSNCGGQCPIMNQNEVSCSPKRDTRVKWFADQGVYFPPKTASTKNNIDEEL